jgi:hypothetical protein
MMRSRIPRETWSDDPVLTLKGDGWFFYAFSVDLMDVLNILGNYATSIFCFESEEKIWVAWFCEL